MCADPAKLIPESQNRTGGVNTDSDADSISAIVQKNFHPDRIRFCESLSPLFPGLSAKPVLAKTAQSDFLSHCLAHFYVVGTRQYFPPQIKCVSFAVIGNFCFYFLAGNSDFDFLHCQCLAGKCLLQNRFQHTLSVCQTPDLENKAGWFFVHFLKRIRILGDGLQSGQVQ